LTTEKRAVEWGISDGSNDVIVKVDLENFVDYATHLAALWVSDLGKFFKLKTVFERFDEPKGGARTANNLIRTIGYKTVEETLEEDDPILVLGEISKIEKRDGKTLIHISGPKAQGMFDLGVCTI
jgi:hypothetical protein